MEGKIERIRGDSDPIIASQERLVIQENGGFNKKGKQPIKSDYKRGRISTGTFCVRMLLISTGVVFLCLTATLIIMFNGIIITESATIKAVVHKASDSSQVHLRHFQEDNKTFRYSVIGNGKMIKGNRHWCHIVRELESVLIKLKNVIDKYEMKREELKALYAGVSHCGLNNCGEFRGLLLENKGIISLKCKKNQNLTTFRKQTKKLLLNVGSGVKNFEKIFKRLIRFEKLPHFEKQGISNGSRLGILKGFQTDVKTLNIEIIELVKALTRKQRLEFSPKPKKLAMKRPISQTDLMIYEWRTIQQSKEFLIKWKEPLERIFTCWEKADRGGRLTKICERNL